MSPKVSEVGSPNSESKENRTKNLNLCPHSDPPPGVANSNGERKLRALFFWVYFWFYFSQMLRKFGTGVSSSFRTLLTLCYCGSIISLHKMAPPRELKIRIICVTTFCRLPMTCDHKIINHNCVLISLICSRDRPSRSHSLEIQRKSWKLNF
jgi:hypothetical protein